MFLAANSQTPAQLQQHIHAELTRAQAYMQSLHETSAAVTTTFEQAQAQPVPQGEPL